MNAATLRAEIASELEGNLLPFWRERSVDNAHGGFVAEMASDGTAREGTPRGLILNSRLLWTFAALYRRFADARDLGLAQLALEGLETSFRDRVNGGYLWRVDAAWKPLDCSKKTYGQAFSIYALSEYHIASGAPEPLEEHGPGAHRDQLELGSFLDRAHHRPHAAIVGPVDEHNAYPSGSIRHL